MKIDIVRRGQILMADQGSYDYYNIVGVFVVIADFNQPDELAKYLAGRPDEAGKHGFKHMEYLSSLIANGLLMKIQYDRWYLGDGDCEGVIVAHPG